MSKTVVRDDSAEDVMIFVQQNKGFGRDVRPEDELLHPKENAKVADASLVETQYFGFNIPEISAGGMGYLVHRPNIHCVQGGVWVFQGFKRDTQASPMFDLWSYMSDRQLIASDLHDYRLENGYGVRVVEPLKKHRMTYEDKVRGNAIDLEFTALAAPVMFADNMHFEAPMRVRGELVLRNARHQIDCFNVRDRSWGRPRVERQLAVPPITWTSGVFANEFSFNCNAYEDPKLNPIWAGEMEVEEGTTLKAGWVCRNGRYRLVTSASKRTEYERDSLLPKRYELTMTDSEGETYDLVGTVESAVPWSGWPNVRFIMTLTKWECRGLSTYGEAQEVHYGDYLRAYVRT